MVSMGFGYPLGIDVGYKNVSSKLYPTLKHEILNEKENQIIYEDIYEFIKSAKD